MGIAESIYCTRRVVYTQAMNRTVCSDDPRLISFVVVILLHRSLSGVPDLNDEP
jgi:hypothetical protein